MKVVSMSTGKRAAVIAPVEGNFGKLVITGTEGTVEFVLDTRLSKGTTFIYQMVGVDMLKGHDEYEFFKGGVSFILD